MRRGARFESRDVLGGQQEVDHCRALLREQRAEPQLALLAVAPREHDPVLHQCDAEVVATFELLHLR